MQTTQSVCKLSSTHDLTHLQSMAVCKLSCLVCKPGAPSCSRFAHTSSLFVNCWTYLKLSLQTGKLSLQTGGAQLEQVCTHCAAVGSLRSEADQYVVEGEVVIHASLASLVALGVALPVSVADLRPQDLRSGRNLRTDYRRRRAALSLQTGFFQFAN